MTFTKGEFCRNQWEYRLINVFLAKRILCQQLNTQVLPIIIHGTLFRKLAENGQISNIRH